MRYVIAMMLVMMAVPAGAAEIQATMQTWYDGDTGWVMIDGKRDKVRVVNIDTPEINHGAKCVFEHELGIRARDFARIWLNRGPVTLIVDDKRPRDRMKKPRLLAHVTRDGEDLGEKLIEAGLAVRWEGHRNRHWCD